MGINRERKGARRWLKERLRLESDIKVKKVWSTGGNKPKVGALLESREAKEEVMRNKSNLGKTAVFIENDNTWKERRNKEIVWKKAKEVEKEERHKGSKERIG